MFEIYRLVRYVIRKRKNRLSNIGRFDRESGPQSVT